MTTSVSIERVSIPLHEPLVITGHSFSHLNTAWVTLERDGVIGRGEGTGSYYLAETQDSIVAAIDTLIEQSSLFPYWFGKLGETTQSPSVISLHAPGPELLPWIVK